MSFRPLPWRPFVAPAPIFTRRCVVPTNAERLAAFRTRLGTYRANETFRRARIDRVLDQRVDRRESARFSGTGEAVPQPHRNATAAARTSTTDRAQTPFTGWRSALSWAMSLALPGA